MSERRFTLVSDGASDSILLPALDWLLQQNSSQVFVGRWADLRGLRSPPRALPDRVRMSVELFPCDLLFVHRDAERESREIRVEEIRRELSGLALPSWVPVVPVRMQEAWLLFEERAIRSAAGNPNGRTPLRSPEASRAEGLPSPKLELERMLRDASGVGSHRMAKLRLGPMKHRLATLITDYGPLRALAAFTALEEELVRVLDSRRWR